MCIIDTLIVLEYKDMEYKTFSLKEHAQKKAMWAGSLVKTTLPGITRGIDSEEKCIILIEEHTPALLKLFDEIIVNATDHERQCRHGPHKTTNIDITFDSQGIFTCRNNGPGIPIMKRDNGIYIPELIFSQFLSGSNLEKPKDSIKGGVNGIGAKLANVHSLWFVVSTKSNGLHYTQLFEDHINVINAPEINKQTKCNEYTEIKFLPDYASLDYQTISSEIEHWVHWRAAIAAAYSGPRVTVTFNTVPIAINSSADLLKLYLDTTEVKQLPIGTWDCAIALHGKQKCEIYSIINGVNTIKGPHMVMIKKQIANAISKALPSAIRDKGLTQADLLKGVYIMISAPIPGAEWGGQRKDELQMSDTNFPTPSPKKLKEIAIEVAAAISANHVNKSTKNADKKVKISKYTPARKLGKTSMLLAAEGDSAISLLRTGLTVPGGGVSFNNCGIISLGGVTMNAMKKVTQVGDNIIISKELNNNKVLNSVRIAIGLEYGKKYTSFAGLHYGAIVGCVDQDADGRGKILSLLLVYFYLFWPELIIAGFFKRFITPLIRVRDNHRKIVAEFDYEDEFERWASINEIPSSW